MRRYAGSEDPAYVRSFGLSHEQTCCFDLHSLRGNDRHAGGRLASMARSQSRWGRGLVHRARTLARKDNRAVEDYRRCRPCLTRARRGPHLPSHAATRGRGRLGTRCPERKDPLAGALSGAVHDEPRRDGTRPGPEVHAGRRRRTHLHARNQRNPLSAGRG